MRQPESMSFGRRDYARWAAVAALCVGVEATAVAAQFAPGDADRLVAIFPPWWNAAESFSAAAEAAPVAGVGAAGFIVGVLAENPGVAARLRGQGAFLVLDGRRYSFCQPSKKIRT